MKKGISYWSFPGGLDGTKPTAEAFDEAKKAGFEAVEVCLGDSGEVSLATTERSAKQVLQAAGNAGIEIPSVATGLFWGKPPTSSDPRIRAEALEIGKKLIDVAVWLETGAVLVVPGAVEVFFDPSSEVVEYETAYGRASEAVSELARHAEGSKVVIGIENVWNKFLLSPMEMKAFVDQFDSERVGAYLDVGNCLLYSFPEHWIRSLGQRITRVHLKDFRTNVGTVDGFVDLLSGDVNWPEVISALKEVGYDNCLTAEMIPTYAHYPEMLIENTSRAMDAILGR